MLVSILQLRSARLGGLLQARKRGEELHGRILHPASFLPLRATQSASARFVWMFVLPSLPPSAAMRGSFHRFLRENHNFAFFLAYYLLDLSVFVKDGVFFISREALPERYVILREDSALEAVLRGDRAVACALWNRLVRSLSLWEHLKRPTIAEYRFEMDTNSQALSLQTRLGRVWPFGTWTTGEGKNYARSNG